MIKDVESRRNLREHELAAALTQCRADLAEGRSVTESVQQHMARIEVLLALEQSAEQTKLAQSRHRPPD